MGTLARPRSTIERQERVAWDQFNPLPVNAVWQEAAQRIARTGTRVTCPLFRALRKASDSSGPPHPASLILRSGCDQLNDCHLRAAAPAEGVATGETA